MPRTASPASTWLAVEVPLLGHVRHVHLAASATQQARAKLALYHCYLSQVKDDTVPGPGSLSCSACNASLCSVGQFFAGCGGSSAGRCSACSPGTYSDSSGTLSRTLISDACFRIMQLERSRRDANHKTGGLDPRSVKRMIQDPKCHLRLEDVCWHM